jgi:nitroreductase
MEFSELIEKRFSTRKYINRPVDDEAIDSLLEAVMAAPSGANLQSYKVAVVTDDKMRAALTDASGPQGWMSEAPVLLVFFADLDTFKAGIGKRLDNVIPLQDATIAMAYAQLAAFDLGLGTCWVAPFAGDSAQKTCGLKGSLLLSGILTVGHTNESKPKRKRRKPSEWSVRT